MSIWETIARDFNWKPLFKGEDSAYPCGATQGWARPISLVPSEGQFEDAGCGCHTNIERALFDWRRNMVVKLLDRVFQISREAGDPVELSMTNGRHQWFGQNPPERIQPLVQEFEALREKIELLHLRLRVHQDLEQRRDPVDRPVPLAGRLTWTDKVYRPR